LFEPRYGNIGFVEARGDQKWIMRSLLELDRDVAFSNHNLAGCIDKVAKNML